MHAALMTIRLGTRIFIRKSLLLAGYVFINKLEGSTTI